MRNKRKHVKKFQDEQYKFADKRIKRAAEIAYWSYDFEWYLKPTREFKRYQLL